MKITQSPVGVAKIQEEIRLHIRKSEFIIQFKGNPILVFRLFQKALFATNLLLLLIAPP